MSEEISCKVVDKVMQQESDNYQKLIYNKLNMSD